MAIATFKDLCIDAADPALVGRFWGELLGLDHEALPDGDSVLRRAGTPVIWVNRVPEAKEVKNRVHLDLWVDDETELMRRGARVLADQDGFRVWADPEGNEFCAFPVPAGVELDAPARWYALCTDSDRPEELAAWWAAVAGGEVGPGPDGTPRWLHGVQGLAATAGHADVLWKFVAVQDARVAKNRCHWDVTADVDDLVAAGATVVRPPGEQVPWTVLVDPQGNELCAFAPDR